MHCYFDRPATDTLCDPLCFSVEGWLHAGERHDSFRRIEVWIGDTRVGSTSTLGPRDAVAKARGLPMATLIAFQVFCHYPKPPPHRTPVVDVRVFFGDDSTGEIIARLRIKFVGHDYRQDGYGHTLDSSFLAPLHREQVYGSGPSQTSGSQACVGLLKKFLGPPPVKVIDVGCGLGFYGRELLAAGYDWMGAEVKAADCAALAKMGLPHRQIDGRRLPFADGGFDAAICVEVLEHIENVDVFLADLRRVARRLLVSVPNFEPVSYLSHLAVVPWHLLEGDHKNFFTRWSLGETLRRFFPSIEVVCYHEMPLRSREDTPLYYNLFACASA